MQPDVTPDASPKPGTGLSWISCRMFGAPWLIARGPERDQRDEIRGADQRQAFRKNGSEIACEQGSKRAELGARVARCFCLLVNQNE